jgi:hypothetical protein
MTSERASRRGPGTPSGVGLVFCVLALVVPLAFSGRILNSDGDLPRHLVLGRHILTHGVVFPDVFSHTLPGRPFIAYEWLSEVVLALTERIGGLVGVTVLAGALVATSIALVLRYLRPRVEPTFAIPVAFLAAMLTGPHWIARPHLFSFLCLSLLLGIATRPPGWRRHLGLLFLFAVWANLHPGFFYGLAILGAYLAGDILDHRTVARLRGDVLSGLAAVAGSLANPLGWNLHLEIVRSLGDTRSFAMIQEFGAPSLKSGYGLLFYGLIAGSVALLAVGRRIPSLSVLLPLAAASFAGITAQRNATLFGLFALPLVVASVGDRIRAWSWKPIAGLRKRLAEDDEGAATVPWVLGAVALLLALVWSSGRIGPVRLVPDDFSPQRFPVAAVSRARSAGLDRLRIFNEYTWGGYILWAWPGERIYIDGMANFFGSSLMDEYVKVMSAAPDWQDILRRRHVRMILVPPGAPLAHAAEESGSWTVWYRDDVSVVLLEKG